MKQLYELYASMSSDVGYERPIAVVTLDTALKASLDYLHGDDDWRLGGGDTTSNVATFKEEFENSIDILLTYNSYDDREETYYSIHKIDMKYIQEGK